MKLIDSPDALAALGVLQAVRRCALDAGQVAAALEDPETAARLRHAVAGGSPKLWLRGDEKVRLDVPQPVVDGLGTAWRQGADEFAGRFGSGPWLDRRLRLLVEGPRRDDDLGEAFRRAFEIELGPALRSAYATESVPLADRSLRGNASWRWPLRVGFLDDADSRELRQRTAESYQHSDLTEIVDLASGGECDLLIAPSAIHLEIASQRGVRASFALVLPLSDADDTASRLRGRLPIETARLAARTLGASAAAVVSSGENPGVLYARLLDELSHDRTADVALGRAAAQPPVVVGDPGFLDATRVTRSLAEVRRRVEDRHSTGRISHEDFHLAIDRFDRYAEETSHGGWDSETRNGSVGAHTTREVEARVPEAAAAAEPLAPSVRRLQAQVFERTGDGLAQRRHAFAPGGDHSIQVRVGRSHLDWMGVERSFPTEELPPDEDVHPLDVLMVAPELLDEPVERRIWLPAGADSTVAEFDLTVPAAVDRVSATFHVLHRNTPLQAARLDGPVATADAAADDGLSFSLGRAAALDLDHHTSPQLLVVKNGQDVTVRYAASPEAKPKPFNPSLPGIEQAMTVFRDQLFAKANAVFQLESAIDEGHGLELLVFLAQQGSYLRGEMLGRLTEAELAEIGRVHVWSPYAPDFLPVEFFYDHPFPDDDAALCPNFLAGDADGGCADCRAAGDPAFVCPSGFWALDRVIERQVRDWDGDSEPQPESSTERAEIHLVDDVIFAASDRVNDGQTTDVVADTFARLSAHVGGRAHRVASWNDWVETLNGNYPALLVTLPHHGRSPHHLPSLQIGADQDLVLPRMDRCHLMPEAATEGPMVLLLGCNTAAAEFAYQDFVRRLRDKGAPVVVATLTTVIGAQAAPLAVAFVEQLWQRGDEVVPLGKVMRKVRAAMVRAGNPVALALAAYGDADWRLAPRSGAGEGD